MIHSQKSFSENSDGVLYLIPTPIGNLEDMTLRAIRILKEVDVIAAEDTRQTRKLLNHFQISTPLVSYHDHNKLKSGEKLLADIHQGKSIGLVSDAGFPAISDPGYELVKAAVAQGMAVIPLPGANAALPALVASGLPTEHFYFYGFLNRGKKEKKQELEGLKEMRDTLIFYESPHRLKATLTAMLEVLGDRKIALSRELTKRYEEFIRGTIAEVIHWSETEEVRGEFCLVVEGSSEWLVANEQGWWATLTVREHIEHYVAVKGYPSKEAIKLVSKERGLKKQEVYQIYHIENKP